MVKKALPIVLLATGVMLIGTQVTAFAADTNSTKTVAKTYGREFYEEIGHKGGKKVKSLKEHKPEFYEEIGHKGGKKVK